jgi:hypothetical protein
MHSGGAPPHFSIVARTFLNDKYLGRWVGQGGPIAWPSRSPDLNVQDFYLWGHLKSIVYAIAVNAVVELQQRVEGRCELICNVPGIS